MGHRRDPVVDPCPLTWVVSTLLRRSRDTARIIQVSPLRSERVLSTTSMDMALLSCATFPPYGYTSSPANFTLNPSTVANIICMSFQNE